jgi:molybdopterin-biosynthesis enzyme MoeA-like protein
MARSDIILTTGGLGPTVDDPTRQAVAQAVGVDLEYRPELWEQILARFARFGRVASENNRRQAYIPRGAAPVENPVGTAPAFIFETGEKVIISVPGVPREMEHLIQQYFMPYLCQKYHLTGTIQAHVLHTVSIGESSVDELIGDLETLTNPTVGLLAHPGQVDIRVTAKAGSVQEAESLIEPVVKDIKERLGSAVFGMDGQTLEVAMQQVLAQRQWQLAVVQAGMGSLQFSQIPQSNGELMSGVVFYTPISQDDLEARVMELAAPNRVVLGANLTPGDDKQDLLILLVTPEKREVIQRSYGGPPANAPQWAANLCMDMVRIKANESAGSKS